MYYLLFIFYFSCVLVDTLYELQRMRPELENVTESTKILCFCCETNRAQRGTHLILLLQRTTGRKQSVTGDSVRHFITKLSKYRFLAAAYFRILLDLRRSNFPRNLAFRQACCCVKTDKLEEVTLPVIFEKCITYVTPNCENPLKDVKRWNAICLAHDFINSWTL